MYRAAKADAEDHPVPGQLLEGGDLLGRPAADRIACGTTTDTRGRAVIVSP
jgi:hypothetical protein